MKLILERQRDKLLRNHALENPRPVVKWFTPWGGATWLICSIDPEEPRLAFGLCDLGLGFPEIGDVWIPEIEALRGPAGLRVERDMFFEPSMTLTEYADQARADGRIVA